MRTIISPILAIALASPLLAQKVLRNLGADVTISVDLLDALERAGTGAKEKLVV